MITIREFLIKELPRFTTPLAARSVIKTLSAHADKEMGGLDVVDLQGLLMEVEVGLKTFGASPPTAAVRTELRRLLAGMFPPRAREEIIRVKSDTEVLYVQTRCMSLCRGFFNASDTVRLATAVSELARNIYMYAKEGEIKIRVSEEPQFYRFEVNANDKGPGIPNLDLILSGKYVSRTGMGKGLAGTKALLDSCTISSAPGRGTLVTGFKRARRI